MQETLYISPREPFKELKMAISAFEAAGYDTDSVRIGPDWPEFIRQATRGTTVVVHSVDFFPSLMELLSTLAELQERGITLKSLQEPWLSEEVGSTTDFLLKLRKLALLLHQNRTCQGIEKARAAGKRIGRPRKAIRG